MIRLRLRFNKLGPIRFISHLDTMRAFERCFRSCDLPLVFTQGFHPHPKISLGPPLKTGWESLDEYMDVFLERSPQGGIDKCNAALPEGLRILASETIPLEVPSLSADIAAARYEISLETRENGGEGNAAYIGSATGEEPALDERAGLTSRVDPLPIFFRDDGESCTEASGDAFTPEVLDMGVEEREKRIIIEYLTTMKNGRGLNAGEVLRKLLPNAEPALSSYSVTRKELFVKRNHNLVSPLNVL